MIITRPTLRLLAGAAADDVLFFAGDLALAADLAFAEPVKAYKEDEIKKTKHR
jgi:hypothetical protein